MSDEPSRPKRIFVSYSESIGPWVGEVANQIRGMNHDVFLARQSIVLGESWPRQIDGYLDACDVFILFSSKHCVGNVDVQDEADRAIALRRRTGKPRIISVQVDATEPRTICGSFDILQHIKLSVEGSEEYRAAYRLFLHQVGVEDPERFEPPALLVSHLPERVTPAPAAAETRHMEPPQPELRASSRPTLAKSFLLADRGSAVAVGAHWDDILLGCFGTLLNLKWLHDYDVTLLLLCTEYEGTYYRVRQKNLEDKVEAIYDALTRKFKLKWEYLTGTRNPSCRDRRLRKEETATLLQDRMRAFAGTHNECNLVFTPPIDDKHDDHAFASELASSYFREPHQTVLEYEIKHYSDRAFVPNIFVDLTGVIRADDIMPGRRRSSAHWKISELPRLVTKGENQVANSAPFFGKESIRSKLRMNALDYSGNTEINYGEAFRGRISI
jgi:hypothetical protein